MRDRNHEREGERLDRHVPVKRWDREDAAEHARVREHGAGAMLKRDQ
ncbi:MAG TPA: hypothetical protein VG371_06735 [Solirubrobacteraceae bacterium]|nr:hypothetical protein [Solirubrobacteraceae bacterium]